MWTLVLNSCSSWNCRKERKAGISMSWITSKDGKQKSQTVTAYLPINQGTRRQSLERLGEDSELYAVLCISEKCTVPTQGVAFKLSKPRVCVFNSISWFDLATPLYALSSFLWSFFFLMLLLYPFLCFSFLSRRTQSQEIDGPNHQQRS